MELIQEQIRKIEHYLNTKDVRYIDIRYEVLDHMVSDIEKQIQEGESYEDAFYSATMNWNEELETTSSWMLGLIHNKPKMIIRKAKNFFMPWFIIMMVVFILMPFLITKRIDFSFIPKKVEFVFFVLGILSIISIATMFVKMNIQKVKTTYSFLFKSQVFPSIFFLFFIYFDIDFSLTSPASSLVILFSILLIFLSVFGYKLFLQHSENVKKYVLKNAVI